MFKAIDVSRPWPATGMTSQKWLDVRLYSVGISSLIATQDGVYIRPLIEPETPVGGDHFPHVIYWNKTLYLEDGHHRVVRAAMAGKRCIVARVLIIKD